MNSSYEARHFAALEGIVDTTAAEQDRTERKRRCAARKAALLADEDYTPEHLLDRVSKLIGAKNDTQLAAMLGFDRAQVCRIRYRRDVVSGPLMVAILDRCPNLSIRDVRRLGGLPTDRAEL